VRKGEEKLSEGKTLKRRETNERRRGKERGGRTK
jgi:hypothetical protein